MKLIPLAHNFTVCRVSDYQTVDLNDPYVFIAKTHNENSLVVQTERIPQNIIKKEDGFRGFYIDGELDFSLIGILAKISKVLADNNIGIFVVSSFNTDYVFVKEENFNRALELLEKDGYNIEKNIE